MWLPLVKYPNELWMTLCDALWVILCHLNVYMSLCDRVCMCVCAHVCYLVAQNIRPLIIHNFQCVCNVMPLYVIYVNIFFTQHFVRNGKMKYIGFQIECLPYAPISCIWPKMGGVRLFYTSVHIFYLQRWQGGAINVTLIMGSAIVCLSFSAVCGISLFHCRTMMLRLWLFCINE